MHTFRHLSGAPEDLLFPTFRNVNFSDEDAMILVSHYLRLAWLALPPTDPTDINSAGVGAWIAASTRRSEQEWGAVPQNPDVRELQDADVEVDIRSPWREAGYEMWNHVFQDVSNFIQSVGAGMGHLHPPAHKIFALHYPSFTSLVRGEVGGNEMGGEGTEMVRETDMLVIWAWLGDGVEVRMTTGDVTDEEMKEMGNQKTLGSFVEGATETEIWYVRRGTRVRFYVEGKYEGTRKGLAAVMVTGRLDLECPGKKKEAGTEDISTGANQEVASAFANVVNLMKEAQEQEHK
jgi:hypothetical protein